MRTRTVVAATTAVLTLGGLGMTVASGATPIWNAELPTPSLVLGCPETLELGDAGALSGTLGDTTSPIGREDVTVARADEFGAGPVEVGVGRTRNDGAFDGLSDTPVNRGDQTYEAVFAGNDSYAAASAECVTAVHGVDSEISVDTPAGVTVGEDVAVTGRLVTAAGDPVADAEIAATDAVAGQPSDDLATTTTDSEGNFTVTAGNVAAGHHTVTLSFGGDEVVEPTTQQAEFDVDSGTGLSVEPVAARFAGEDIAVSGTLANGAGEPLSGATIAGTDTVGGTTTDLAETTTDSAGGFTVTVPNAAPGHHTIDLSYAGDGPNKPATGRVEFELRYETTTEAPASGVVVGFIVSSVRATSVS